MISWGETGAPGASVACTWPATFGPSYVAGAVDQMPTAATIRAAIAARTTILRMVSPSAACERRDCIRISPVAPSVRWVTQAVFLSCLLAARRARVTNGLPCEPVVRSPAPFPAREAKAGAPVPPPAPLKKIPPAGERGGICRRTDAGEGQVHRVAPT